jgi:hypothetical protein
MKILEKIFATAQPRNRATAQPRNRATAQPRNRATAQPRNRATAQPRNKRKSFRRPHASGRVCPVVTARKISPNVHGPDFLLPQNAPHGVARACR